MNRLEGEHYLTMTEAAKQTPGRPCVATLHRWVSLGVNGVTLESFRVGRKRMTSREALERFLDRMNQPTHETAEDELIVEGL